MNRNAYGRTNADIQKESTEKIPNEIQDKTLNNTLTQKDKTTSDGCKESGEEENLSSFLIKGY